MQAVLPLARAPPGEEAKYFFPPPWILWNEKDEKRDHYYHNYIRIREFCLRRFFSEDFHELPRKTEYWREAIKGNFTQVSGLKKDIATQGLLTKMIHCRHKHQNQQNLPLNKVLGRL